MRLAGLYIAGWVARAAQASDLTIVVSATAGVPVAEAVVALHAGAGVPPAASREWAMEQVDKQLVPSLLAIHSGDRVKQRRASLTPAAAPGTTAPAPASACRSG